MALEIQTRTVYIVGNSEYKTRAEAEEALLPTLPEFIRSIHTVLNENGLYKHAKIALIKALRSSIFERNRDYMSLKEAKEYIDACLAE